MYFYLYPSRVLYLRVRGYFKRVLRCIFERYLSHLLSSDISGEGRDFFVMETKEPVPFPSLMFTSKSISVVKNTDSIVTMNDAYILFAPFPDMKIKILSGDRREILQMLVLRGACG
jgi:hypothetical protein